MNMNHRQRTIFARYTEAMVDVTTNGLIEIQTAQLVLALALRDLESAMSAVKADDASILASIVHHIERMIDHNAHDLYERLLSGEFTTVDQALAVHFQRTDQELFNLREDLDAARVAHASVCEQRDSLQVQLLAMDADNASLTEEVHRLRSWTVEADARAAAAQPPPVVSAFVVASQEAEDYRIGLDAGRWTWREVPKRLRLELVRSVIAATANRTQAEFDAVRPSWMATATAHCSAFSATWRELADLTHEIEVRA